MSHGGNEGVARQRAFDSWKGAANGGDPKDVAKLKAALDAAVAVENDAKGTPGQRRY